MTCCVADLLENSIVETSLNLSPADHKADLLYWLAEEGRFAPDTGGLLEMLCEKLAALGVQIARATVHVRTLHPEFRGISRVWRRGESIEIRTARHGIEYTSDYQDSPVQHIIETGQWLDITLNDTTDRRFPILATLRAQGITHYVMAPLIFSNRIVNSMSWATDAPGGFTKAEVELFRDLVTAITPILEVTAVRRTYRELLATYVGRDPGARIVAGRRSARRRPPPLRRQCCSPTCAASAHSQMSFQRIKLLNSLMASSTWWSPASLKTEATS